MGMTSRFSIFHSKDNFYDFAIIVTTLVCCIYVALLFCSTINYVRYQTSLVNDIKKHRLTKINKRLYTKRDWDLLKTVPKKLNYEQCC
jgi:hypothetical protein